MTQPVGDNQGAALGALCLNAAGSMFIVESIPPAVPGIGSPSGSKGFNSAPFCRQNSL